MTDDCVVVSRSVSSRSVALPPYNRPRTASRRGGETNKALKILVPEMGVWVRFPPRHSPRSRGLNEVGRVVEHNAAEGSASFAEILTHHYPGTALETRSR